MGRKKKAKSVNNNENSQEKSHSSNNEGSNAKRKAKQDKDSDEFRLRKLMERLIGKHLDGQLFCTKYLNNRLLYDNELINALESPLGIEFVPEPCSKGKQPYMRLAEKVQSVLKIWDKQPKASPARRVKAPDEIRLRNVMYHYIKENIPGKIFCADFLKIKRISDGLIAEAIESPLGIELLPQPKGRGREPYELLATKVLSVLNDEFYSNNKLEPIEKSDSVSGLNTLQKLAMNVEKTLKSQQKAISNEQEFDEFSGELGSFLKEMKGEVNEMSSNRKRHLPELPSEVPKKLTRAERRNRQKNELASSSSLVVTTAPTKNFFSPFTPNSGALQLRFNQLRACRPDDVEKSDSDQSGSEEEIQDYATKNFSSQMIVYRQERETENLRNRSFGMPRKSPRKKKVKDVLKNYRRYFRDRPESR